MINRPEVETLIYASLSMMAVSAVLLGLPMPGPALQNLTLALGVALIGLPHGALDPLLARRAGMLDNWQGIAVFHVAYLAAAGLVLALWFIAPPLTLLVFLLYSAYHFAGDWSPHRHLARLALGAALLSLPSFLHVTAVADIFVLLSGETARTIAQAQHWLAPVWFTIISAAAAFFLWQRQFWNALELVLLAITAMLLPPLVFFLLYFCALHSPRHFLQIWRASADRQQAAWVAAGYTGATLLICIPAALTLANPVEMDTAIQRIIFIGLAALTVPHMLLDSILKSRPHD